MAIELTDLHEILNILEKRPQGARGRLLILGSADVHISSKVLSDLLLKRGIKSDLHDELVTPFNLGDSLGFESTETLDVNGKASITHDLMLPVPDRLLERYDMIIDAGVLFWCFNPGIALQNILCMLRTGGDVVHITAVSGFYGRGYYNIHPKLLDDFYGKNKCIFLVGTFRSRRVPQPFWRRVLNKIGVASPMLGGGNMLNTRSGGFGYSYLLEKERDLFQFSSEPPDHYLQMIPNDILGFLSYRKLEQSNMVSPVLTEIRGLKKS